MIGRFKSGSPPRPSSGWTALSSNAPGHQTGTSFMPWGMYVFIVRTPQVTPAGGSRSEPCLKRR